MRGGRGGVLVHHYFLLKILVFERLEHLKKSWFFDANYLSDLLAIPKKNCAYAQSFFEFPVPIPIPIPIPSKFSEKRMTHSPIPIPSGLRGMTTAGENCFLLKQAGDTKTVDFEPVPYRTGFVNLAPKSLYQIILVNTFLVLIIMINYLLYEYRPRPVFWFLVLWMVRPPLWIK